MNCNDAIEINKPPRRIRWLCSDLNPDVDGPNGRDAYCRQQIELATGVPQSFPPAATQAVNAIAAVGRGGLAAVTRNVVFVSDPILKERETVCSTCDQLKDNRCLKCGCFYKKKIRLATEECPLKKWLRASVNISTSATPTGTVTATATTAIQPPTT